MTQTSLFDAPPDPMWRPHQETSRAAARTVDVNAREEEVLLALRLNYAAIDTHDIAAILQRELGVSRDRNCIARRLTSLERKRLVRRVGVKSGAHGKPTTTWALT